MAGSIDCLKPIFPKYDYIKTDKSQEMCATYLNSKNRFNRIPGMGRRKVGNQVPRMISGKLTTKDIDWKGKARPLFYHYTTGEPSVLCCGTTDECDEPPPVICRGRTRTRCTQTHYRESSAQTRPYQPPIAGDKENYQNYEIYQISKLLDGYEFPGEYEAKVVERARRRRQYQRALLLVANDKEKHDTILEAMEWEDWVAREEDIQGCQMLRMEIVERMFKEREENFIKQSEKRIQMNSQKIHAKRSAQLKKINVEYARGVRRLEAAKQKISRKYRKGNIVDDHINPASDLHAPQMRFGVNPNRRHFVGFRKSFDERIEDLDKKKDERGVLASLTCPFSKLRTWAKPKEQIREVSQRFLSDENLKNMYDSLKRLRTIAEAPKPIPKCLKKKVIPVQEEEEEDLSPKDDFRLLAARKSCDEYQTEIEEKAAEFNDEGSEISGKDVEMLRNQRMRDLTNWREKEIENILGEFQGTTLGSMLQTLSNELGRLKTAKKFQAIRMLAQRERYKRETYEAGRRQKENKIREDHDRLLEAVGEVHKDTATIFLRSVLEEEFELSSEAIATDYITKLARKLDKQDVNLALKLQTVDGLPYQKDVVVDCVKNQVFELAKKRYEKANADKMKEATANAIKDELFGNIETVLTNKYKTPDGVQIVGELLDEQIYNAPIYDFDSITPDTSDDEQDFDPREEIPLIIEKLVQLAVRHPGVRIDFMDDSEYVNHLQAQREVEAIMRKLVRIAVPEERWKTQGDRIVEQCLSDTFDGALYEVECLKLSRVVRCDDRLQEAITRVYARMKSFSKAPCIPSQSNAASSYITNWTGLKSIESRVDIFEGNEAYWTQNLGQFPKSKSETELALYNYLRKTSIQIVGPFNIGPSYERTDIRRSINFRYQEVGEEASSSSSSLKHTTPTQLQDVATDASSLSQILESSSGENKTPINKVRNRRASI